MGIARVVKNILLCLSVVTAASVVWIQVNVGFHSARGFILMSDADLNRTVRVLSNMTVNTGVQTTSTAPAPQDLLVHLLSYQRSGSSFMGGLFHSNPTVFFIYEPIDMIYAAMYGTEPGWASPADIFLDRTKSIRKVTQEEKDGMLFMMDKIYSCQLSTLPVSSLTHPFWANFVMLGWMPTSKDYMNCLESKRMSLKRMLLHNKCRVFIKTLCPRRYDSNAKNLQKCKQVLWNDFKWQSSKNETEKVFGKRFSRNFNDYFICLRKYEPLVRECARLHLDAPCKNSTVKVIKTVRATMEIGEQILGRHENSKLIHLVRDPRGVAKSRATSSWSWGLREGKKAGDRAKPYCLQAAEDSYNFKNVTRKYPGRTMRLIYDEMVYNTTEHSHNIYEFLGKDMPPETKKFLNKNTKNKVTMEKKGGKGKKTATKKAYTEYAVSWKNFFTATQISEIRKVCRRFYSEVAYNWI